MDSRDYFATVADKWDEMRAGYFSEAVRDKALAAAGVDEGRTAADVGTGTGFVTEALIEAGLSVIAVDRSPEMLDRLEAKFGSTGRVECRLGGGNDLPLKDGEVDYVFANMYLHHVEEPPAAVAEMARVLKPGGVMVITDLDRHDHAFLLREQHDRWPGFDREEVAGWLKAAGLKDAAVESVGQNCCAASECGSERAAVSIFVAAGRKQNV